MGKVEQPFVWKLAGEPKFSEKACVNVTLSSTNLKWPDPGLNRRGGDKQARATTWPSLGLKRCSLVLSLSRVPPPSRRDGASDLRLRLSLQNAWKHVRILLVSERHQETINYSSIAIKPVLSWTNAYYSQWSKKSALIILIQHLNRMKHVHRVNTVTWRKPED
jgi:hypothetical protein